VKLRTKTKRLFAALGVLATTFLMTGAGNVPRGLNPDAAQELADAGVTQYVGQFTPAFSEELGEGWTKHTFDPDGGDGPICIAGTPTTAFTKKGNPAKLLIMLQGGGACWQNFYFCNILADAAGGTALGDLGRRVRHRRGRRQEPDRRLVRRLPALLRRLDLRRRQRRRRPRLSLRPGPLPSRPA
jgi:hypothetical protein